MQKEINSLKRRSIFAGILFLVQMIAASVSHSAILVPILGKSDFLANVSANSNKVIFAMLLDLVCGLSVFGISVILFPILRKFSESIAFWYVGLRLNEWICAVISGVFLLTILSISKEYVLVGTPEHSYLQTMGNYFLEARGITRTLMLLGFCFSASLFYYLLFKTNLLPRFISIWGLTGVLLLFIEIMSNIFGHSLGGIIIMLPMGLNEIFLGIWLMAKGFNSSAITSS